MNYDKYKNTLEYPKKPSKPKEPKLPRKTTDPEVISLYADEMKEYANVMAKHANAILEHQAEMKAYREENNRLYEEFKNDAIEDVGLTGHSKAEKVWDFAWRKGSSSGYAEVYDWLEEVSELVLD